MSRAAGRRLVDVLVVGGGQSALAVGWYLRRAGLAPHSDFVLLDDAAEPGGAWPRMWPTLRTFSPTAYSSLPGWPMPPWREDDGNPSAAHVAAYLAAYEERYDLPVERPTRVVAVRRPAPEAGEDPERLVVATTGDTWAARHVVSATGTWGRPFWPSVPGMREFRGRQLHAADYRRAADLADGHVVVVGGGNSAAQILAEVSEVTSTTWVTLRPPRFLPDDVDGRALFEAANAKIRGEGGGVGSLGDIVMVPSVKDARDRGALEARPMVDRLVGDGVAWGEEVQPARTVVWCTGFRPVLRHLHPLGVRDHGRVATVPAGPGGPPTTAAEEPRLHLVGYGDWTGPGSATLIGVGHTARDTVTALLRDR